MKSIRIDRLGFARAVCRNIRDDTLILIRAGGEAADRAEDVAGGVAWRQIIAEGVKDERG